MSKIGKKLIPVPQGVTVIYEDGVIRVKGPKGELSKKMPFGIELIIAPEGVRIQPTTHAIWGLARALVAQMIRGVSESFTKVLELNGVGYRATVKGSTLELSLGFSHPIIIEAPAGITFVVEKNVVTISGMDAETVGAVAAKIRAVRPPEPYKGSGVKYKDEVIRRKAGKKAAGTTTA